MRPSVLIAILGAALATASPASRHVVHERRNEHSSWAKLGKPAPEEILHMRVGLRQRNIEKGAEWLDQVSNPSSSKFGRHWAPEEVIDAFRPSDETIYGVTDWLAASGINNHQLHLGLHWVEFNASVTQVERLLKAEYSVFRHDSGTLHVACDSYSLPEHVAPKVDLVMPTVHFDHGVSATPAKRQEFKPAQGLLKRGEIDQDDALKTCGTMIRPDCLRALYSFPSGTTKHPNNSIGVAVFHPFLYNPTDLDRFFSISGNVDVGSRPILKSIDGDDAQQRAGNGTKTFEANLDLEYAMALTYPQNVTLFQLYDSGRSMDDFLYGLDASYCTFAVENGTGSNFQVPSYCGKFQPTRVISVSFVQHEDQVTPYYRYRQCYEYMKLGLMGVSVLVGSGDGGVDGGNCSAGAGQRLADGGSARFRPTFPATCPYVTAVGGTQLKQNIDIRDALAQNQQPERAAEGHFASGGGFSKQFAMPQYQAEAVKSYLAKHAPRFSASEKDGFTRARGFPDISANGANYLVADNGSYSLMVGTSASTPTLASILTLVNEARLSHGKSTIGFVNPVAYAHPEVFSDIVEGDNHNCDLAGFQAAKGWDPVTGVGTPNFPKLRDLYLSLP